LLNLSSTVTSSCAPITSYAWSVTNYGLPVTLPPGTPTNLPTFSFTPTDDGSYDVTLSVNGGAATDTKTVYVGNLPPSVSLAAVQNLGSGPQVSVSGTITDPGTGDTIDSVSIDWGDGSPTDAITVTGAAGAFACTAPSHTYKTTGAKTITVTATDDDNGSGSAQTLLTVRVALDNSGTLRVLGTSDGDAVAINAPNSLVRVDTSFLTAPADFPAAGVQRLVVDLGAGSDGLVVAGNVNKYLVALGGPGNDVMTDGPARSLLIGGDGTDVLLGGRGEDILIAGGTTFDSNDAALLLMLAEWTSSSSINLRMSHLQGAAGGLNGNNFLNATTILGDASIDILSGGNGTDWLIISPNDIALDAKKDIVEQLV
jgi:PKD repeat protein